MTNLKYRWISFFLIETKWRKHNRQNRTVNKKPPIYKFNYYISRCQILRIKPPPLTYVNCEVLTNVRWVNFDKVSLFSILSRISNWNCCLLCDTQSKACKAMDFPWESNLIRLNAFFSIFEKNYAVKTVSINYTKVEFVIFFCRDLTYRHQHFKWI